MSDARYLYHYPLCPFSRKVRLCLGEKKLDHELRLEKVWEKREDFILLNPSGKVPVLQEPDGLIVAESSVIVEYLEDVYPQTPCLLGYDRPARNEIRRLECWFDDKFYHEVTKLLVYQKALKRFFEPGGPDSPSLRLGFLNLHTHLSYLEYLIEQRNWLAGDQISVADLAAAAHISCMDYLGDVPWHKYPEAKIWYARLKSRPSFRSLLTDVIQGIKPSPHYTNLDF